MGKTSNFIIGALLGAAAGVAVSYLFGPANNTTYDKHYQSRLDKALSDGRRAADDAEADLRRQFEAGRLPKAQRPSTAPFDQISSQD
jgi:gas vesicle protein